MFSTCRYRYPLVTIMAYTNNPFPVTLCIAIVAGLQVMNNGEQGHACCRHKNVGARWTDHAISVELYSLVAL